MAKISNVYGREVLDSRGNPTVEVEITLEDGTYEKVTEEYQTTKAEYDKLVSDGQITNRTIYSSGEGTFTDPYIVR